MTLASALQTFATRVATEFKAIRTEMAALPGGGGGGDITDSGEKRHALIVITPGTTAPTAVGFAVTAVGTATGMTNFSGSLVSTTPRISYQANTAATTAVAGWKATQPTVVLGATSSIIGGFKYRVRFAHSMSAPTTKRAFVGLRDTTAATPTDVNPSSIINCIGLGWDSGDTNMSMT